MFNKEELFDQLISCCGFVANGSQTTVTLSQDDAVMSNENCFITVGKNSYYGYSFEECIQKAAKAGETERY